MNEEPDFLCEEHCLEIHPEADEAEGSWASPEHRVSARFCRLHLHRIHTCSNLRHAAVVHGECDMLHVQRRH
jgi:hypothetical protein